VTYSQDQYLQQFKDNGTLINAYLLSGIKLVGKITDFDSENIKIDNSSSEQLVSKKNISTLLPAAIDK
jgi:RNA chaperone Hfq